MDENQKINLNKRYRKDRKQILYLTPLLTEKQKSLKNQHFSKFYSHLFQRMSKSNIIKTFSLTENSLSMINNHNQKSLRTSIDNFILNKRNFKDPKNINYKLLKFNPHIHHLKSKINALLASELNNSNKIKKIKKNNLNIEKINKDINTISFYNIKFKKNSDKTDNKNIDEKKKTINKDNINIFNKEECIDILNKIRIYNDKEKKRRKKDKKYYENNVREGFFGQKDTYGVPYYYDTSIIYKNEYANKSEKKRHEILLNELNKLKTYLKRQPDKRIHLIKDFLRKFHIDEIEKYNNRQFLNLSDFILNANNSTMSNALKPYLNIKNMLYDVLNNSVDINNFYSEDNNSKQDDKNLKEIKDISNINTSRDKNSFVHTFYNESPKKIILNEEKYYLSPLICRKKTKNLTHSENIKPKLINKSDIPMNDSNNNFCDNNNINKNNAIKKDILDLNSTNSKLKYMKYQKRTFFPSKTFSNNKIIVKEIGKEIRDMENDYNERLKKLEMKNSENKIKNFYSTRHKSFNIETKDKLYICIKNRNNTRLNAFVPIHYNFTKNFHGKMKNLNDIIDNNCELLKSENNIYRERLMSLDNFCLNISDKKNKEIKPIKKKNQIHRVTKGSFDKTKNSKNESEAIKRLYYIPTRKKFGLQEIRNRLKLTEYIVLTHAKNNIYKNKIKQIVNMQK